MVTILASIVQQESASISQNVRMGINFGFQEGRGRVNFSAFLGYRRGDKPGTYEIVPAEADVVRCIYRQFLEGYSPKMIADGLMEAFNNDLVIRYPDRVVVEDDGYEVAFKAGVTVEVEV